MNKKKEKVYNYFIIINSFIQNSISRKLMEDYRCNGEYNICIYKYPLFQSHRLKISKIFDKVYGIPFFESKYKIVKWINFFIYIIYFTIIFLINNKNFKRGKLVLGNFYYHGNRFIVNVFNSFWKLIIILDEGTSTLLIYEERSKFKKKLRLIDRMFFTFQPKRSLIFYTIFKLSQNQHDIIHSIENIFNINYKREQIKINSLLFIGSYFVEENAISEEEFNKLLHKLVLNNPDTEINYSTHPREKFIYDNPLVKELGINLICPNVSIEEFLITNHSNFQIIASCVSTGYIYASNMLGNSVEYQTYVMDFKLPSGEVDPSYKILYKAINKKLEGLNVKNVIV